ncbi:MAG: hypothetical protein JNM60_05935 [Candidatus Competibacteraceae bacterium]|nr:hypothetical protein [Candidatus Competibacteraceae bacterium]
MRISFDLDDTLICGASVPSEYPVARWRRWRYPEPLRRGARALMLALVERRCELWIYTTSSRSPGYLKAWFGSFGVPLGGVVNQERHARVVGLRGPSKLPPAFGIHLHIDDSPGVALEGTRHRFDVLTVALDDARWAERILREVDARIGSNPLWQARRDAPRRRFFQIGKRLGGGWSRFEAMADARLPDCADHG